jgi:hypothetical protein
MRLNMRGFVNSLAAAMVVWAASILPLSAAEDSRRSFKAEVLFRLANPCPATGRTQGECKGYVIDRVIPLVCGGAEEPGNMQWQTIAEARAKNKWERIGCRPGRHYVMPGTPAFSEAFPVAAPEPVEAQPLPLK